MLIPKNSTVFLATWAIHHLENIYPDPDTFNPDRYSDHPKLANDYAGSPDYAKRGMNYHIASNSFKRC